MAEEFKVTPWEVTGDIDYDRLQQQFGTTPVDRSVSGNPGRSVRAPRRILI